MTRDTDIAKIRKAAVAANPAIIVNKNAQLIKFDRTVEYFEECRPIRLADCLAAIRKFKPSAITNVHIEISGDFCMRQSGEEQFHVTSAQWDCLKDDLTQQSPECIHFIAELLPNV